MLTKNSARHLNSHALAGGPTEYSLQLRTIEPLGKHQAVTQDIEPAFAELLKLSLAVACTADHVAAHPSGAKQFVCVSAVGQRVEITKRCTPALGVVQIAGH